MNFSAHTIRRLASLAGLAAVVAAVAVPAAFAHPATEGGDDTSRAAVLLDLRSPDTADLASGRGTGGQPVVTIASPQGGFDWGDAGIGAGGALALVLLGLGVVLMTSHRRRGVKPPRAVAH